MGLEIIGEAIFMLVDLPGTYVHWLLRRKKLSFREIEERYFGINVLLSLIIYALIIGVIVLVF
ncbi:MAG: hypothetical protein DI539_13760 [Flavobacterium psychrophilum]|nr:MAG: hypothetical protein DI539_13760 [Flavobacterium psychrophilum]